MTIVPLSTSLPQLAMKKTSTLMVVGVNSQYHSASLVEQAYCEEAKQPNWLSQLAKLKEATTLAGDKADFDGGGILLVTCDRVEFILWGNGDGKDGYLTEAQKLASKLISENLGLEAHDPPLNESWLSLEGEAAMRHCLRVACALESRVMGESQILGQFKAAIQAARQHGLISRGFETCLQAILATAKRVRRETKLGEGHISLTNQAMAWRQRLFGGDGSLRGLILGLGEMGEIMAIALERGLSQRFDLTGPLPRTKRVAAERNRHYAPYNPADLARLFAGYDVIICAHGMGMKLLTRPLTDEALHIRFRRPMLVFDMALPTDSDTAIAQLDNLFRLELSQLQNDEQAARESRQQAESQATSIINEELAEYQAAHALEQAGMFTLIQHLRHYAERERQSLLESHPQLAADKFSRLLINRLLHHPSLALKLLTSPSDQEAASRLIHTLFPDKEGEN